MTHKICFVTQMPEIFNFFVLLCVTFVKFSVFYGLTETKAWA